jgi:mRNA interferase MazF
MTRGAIVTMAARGRYTSKPRPAVVVQANAFNPTHPSITVCPITSECEDAPLFRVTLPPGGRTGLSLLSQVMVDKVVSIPREAIGRQIGLCDPVYVDAIDDALRVWLSL